MLLINSFEQEHEYRHKNLSTKFDRLEYAFFYLTKDTLVTDDTTIVGLFV